MAALSLASDLAVGLPAEHAVRSCYMAMHVADQMRLPSEQRVDVYYAELLMDAGCTAWTSEQRGLGARNPQGGLSRGRYSWVAAWRRDWAVVGWVGGVGPSAWQHCECTPAARAHSHHASPARRDRGVGSTLRERTVRPVARSLGAGDGAAVQLHRDRCREQDDRPSQGRIELRSHSDLKQHAGGRQDEADYGQLRGLDSPLTRFNVPSVQGDNASSLPRTSAPRGRMPERARPRPPRRQPHLTPGSEWCRTEATDRCQERQLRWRSGSRTAGCRGDTADRMARACRTRSDGCWPGLAPRPLLSR